MKVYEINPETKEYIGDKEAQINPLEGGYLMPPHCYIEKPLPNKEGFTQIRENNQWKYVKSLEGTIVYHKINKTMAKITGFCLQIPDEYTTQKPLEPTCCSKWENNNWVFDEILKKEYDNNIIKQKLNNIDIKSIRSLREWLAKQATVPQFIKDYETQAIAEREKLK